MYQLVILQATLNLALALMSMYQCGATLCCIVTQGNVLFVRFFEGPASGIDRQGPQIADKRQRIQTNAEALIDIPIIMETMKQAIRQAVAQNR